MSDTYYLCYVPMHGWNIILPERDYKYQRHHEANLHVPNPKNNLVVLAQGSFKEMKLFKDLAGDLTNVS
jgi:hypothetical protein